MLDAYDHAREYARSHEMEVHHGNVAEAQVREWLTGFLPKRYGVTSGYVVSQGQVEPAKLPHFDVIIYDQLEAPVLWIEDTPDASISGTSRALPAEHVRAVIEVKAAFTPTAVAKAIEHLSDLDPLLGIDTAGTKYKKFLPQRFFTSVIFYELRKENQNGWNDLSQFVPDRRRVWPNALILRGEELTNESSATIELTFSNDNPPNPIGPVGKDLFGALVLSKSKPREGTFWSAVLKWSPIEFSTFSFDLLAKLDGTYEPGRMSSLFGISWIDPSKSIGQK